jgi:hypothetical protein
MTVTQDEIKMERPPRCSRCQSIPNIFLNHHVISYIAYVSYFALALVLEAQAECMHEILISLISLLIMKYIV